MLVNRNAGWSLATVALALLPALAAATVPLCPDPEAPSWVEVATSHFLVRTDAGAGVAREAAAHLEQLRVATVKAAFGGRLEAPGVTEVVLLRDDEEMSDITGQESGDERLGGFFQVVAGRGRIVATRKLLPFSSALETLQHEMAHHLLAHAFPRQPRWFAEGMAEFLAAIEVRESGDRPVAILGKPPPPWRWRQRVTPAEILAWNCDGDREVPCYQSAWWMVHYLLNRRGEAFADYQRRLARAEPPPAAWKAAFPDLDPADAKAMDGLETALRDYSRSGKYSTLTVPFDPPRTALAPRPVPCAQVRALHAEMLDNPFQRDRTSSRTRAAADRAESLRLDPSGLSAWRLLASARREPSTFPIAARAVAAHPDDWRGWYLVLVSAGDDPARQELKREAADRLLAAPPDEAGVLQELAGALVTLRQDARAVAVASRAVQLAPWDPLVVDTWATVQANLGNCAEALAASRRAVDLTTEQRGRFRRTLEERRRRIEETCVPRTGDAPSPPPPR